MVPTVTFETEVVRLSEVRLDVRNLEVTVNHIASDHLLYVVSDDKKDLSEFSGHLSA